MDVAVDLRKGSPSYLQWTAAELSAENKRMLYIPRGFGHGFKTLTDDVEFCYKVDNLYSKEHDRGIRFDDPAIGVDWGEVVYQLGYCDQSHFIKECVEFLGRSPEQCRQLALNTQ